MNTNEIILGQSMLAWKSNDYCEIEKIKEMKIEGKSAEDIEAKVSRESKLNPGMVAYIMSKETPAWMRDN